MSAYYNTKLTSKSQMYLSALTSSNRSRSKEVSIAIARIVSNRFSIPVGVQDITAYYNTQVRLELEAMVNSLNNLVVLDIQSILDYSAKFYNFRYLSACPSVHILAVNNQTAVVDFFSISRIFDEAFLKILSEHAVCITEATLRFSDILEEIADKESKEGVPYGN